MGESSETNALRNTPSGPVASPEPLWGTQTQLAIANFPVSGYRIPRPLIEALALVKGAAAQANATLGVLDPSLAEAIASAADEVARGTYDDHFPVDVFQTGSGTSSNMNMNEVIASLASSRHGAPVHPNDHVNASQSSNDVFPTSVHLAAVSMTTHDLLPALDGLSRALDAKAREFASFVKPGRTHLMDATPVTLGQEFGGYAAAVRLGIGRIESALERAVEVPLGGTAVGTGLNAPAGFAQEALRLLNGKTGLGLREARDHFEAQGSRDSLVELSGSVRTVAVSLTKICNDLRLMASGPATGLREIRLPALQAGSSIMPGKVNPVIPESVLQVCSRVVGNDATVAWAGASGTLELNVQIPVMALALLESIRLLAAAARLLGDKAVMGIEADATDLRRLAEASASIVTPLNPILGYEAAAAVVERATEKGLTIREAVVDLGFVDRGEITEDQLDALLDVEGMTGQI